MSNEHFVYAVDCGHYDAEGYPIRIFGRSASKESFISRFRGYMPACVNPPVLCGVIPCENKEHAIDTEKSVLALFADEVYPERPKSEVRRGTERVLAFIATEMQDGEAFLGGVAHELFLAHERARVRTRKRDYMRELRKCPKYRAREKKLAQERAQRKQARIVDNASRTCIAVDDLFAKV